VWGPICPACNPASYDVGKAGASPIICILWSICSTLYNPALQTFLVGSLRKKHFKLSCNLSLAHQTSRSSTWLRDLCRFIKHAVLHCSLMQL
jgi:hypothetical protein